MSLDLDARQRAMLQAMGITWCTLQVPATEPPASRETAARTGARTGARTDAQTGAQTDTRSNARTDARTSPQPPPPASPQASDRTNPRPGAAPAAATPRAAAPVRAATAAPAQTPIPGAPALRLHAPQPLYPAADPAQIPAELGSGWLIVTESANPAEPLAGDAGRLLANMLRAMRLHRHPRVHLAVLERLTPPAHGGPAPPPGAQPGAASATAPGTATGTDIPALLTAAIAHLRPAIVLLLGLPAARAALGLTDPLGRLRAGQHQLAGCPAVVSYDPAFLLRSQQTKAAAWSDLCHALATVRGATA